MTLPSPEEIESAIEILKRDEFGMWSGEIADAERILLSIATALKSGELVKPANEEEIEEIMANTPTPSSDGDIHPSEFHIIAKALVGKVGELVGKEKYMSVEEVEKILFEARNIFFLPRAVEDRTEYSLDRNSCQKLAQALTRLPKGNIAKTALEGGE